MPALILWGVAVGDGHSAVLAEGAGGDLYAGWGLAAFVFVAVNQSNDSPDGGFVEARLDEFVH